MEKMKYANKLHLNALDNMDLAGKVFAEAVDKVDDGEYFTKEEAKEYKKQINLYQELMFSSNPEDQKEAAKLLIKLKTKYNGV